MISVIKGKLLRVLWLAERQPSSGVTWVRSLPVAPSSCDSGPSGRLIESAGQPSLRGTLLQAARVIGC